MENQEKKVEILNVNGKKVVRSFEFYKVTGLKGVNYTRWITETVLEIGEPNKDLFPTPDNIADRLFRRTPRDMERDRIRYYFDIDFAIALCLVVKRKEALLLRKFLIENK